MSAIEFDGADYSEPAADVCDLSDLDYHTAEVRRYRAQLARVQESFRAEMERMRDRLQERERILNERINWHLLPIESYHRAHPKERTLTLAHGTAKLRVPKTPMAWIKDPDEVHKWALAHHPEITKPPSVSEVRKLVVIEDVGSGFAPIDCETGEIIPGMYADLPEPTWTLDTEEGEPF